MICLLLELVLHCWYCALILPVLDGWLGTTVPHRPQSARGIRYLSHLPWRKIKMKLPMSYDIVLLGTTSFAHKNLYLLFNILHVFLLTSVLSFNPSSENSSFFVHVKSTDLLFIMVYLRMFFKLYFFLFLEITNKFI